MLDSIGKIKEKVHNSIYERDGSNTKDVEAIIAALKEDEKFKNFSEDELYSYAYGLISNSNAHALKGAFQSMGFNSGKPKDPFWSQYTYEEILNMAENGVMVPQEFVDWAHTMQDSDTTSYQIELSTEDACTYENLMAQTDNLSPSALQKRAQAFASKAQAQEELINDKVEETKPILNTVQAEKNDLEKNQAASLQKLESLTNEWKSLDRKFKNGNELTDSEQRRYKELGLMLNDRNNNLVIQTQKISGDIDDLMKQIDNIDMLLNINEKINSEIENIATQISWTEGNKKHIILPTSSGNQITGLNASFYTAAMGNNLAIDTGLTGINLFVSNIEITNMQGSNLALANETQEQVDTINEVSENKDQNLEYTTNKQAETQGSDKKSEKEEDNKNQPENKSQNPGQPQQNQNKTDAQQKLFPVNGITSEEEQNIQSENTNTTAPLQTPENQVDSETGSITGFADIVSQSPETETRTNIQLQSKAAETVDSAATISTTQTAAADTNTALSSAVSDTNANAETSAASSATGTTETTENTQASVETEDPAKAETSQYVSECQSRNSAMTRAEQQIQAKSREIQQIRNSQKIEDAKINAELKKNLSEYENLAKKVQNGETLSAGEQKRVKTLEKTLNSNNGTLIMQMQDKVTALTGFASQLQSDIQAAKDNKEYGTEAVEKGKEYAKSVLGDRSYLNNNIWFTAMSKEKQYDLLYGKAGESIGRDAIDNGELLINNSVTSAERLSKSLPLAGFAMNYSNELNARIQETTTKVSSIQEQLKQSARDSEPDVNGTGNASGTSSGSSSKGEENKEVTQEDGQKIEKQGKEVEKDGKDAKKDGEDAKKDKQATDKQIKKETASLKADEARIKNYTKDSQQINKQFEQMSNEVEAILETQGQSETSGSDSTLAPSLNANTAVSAGPTLNAAGTSCSTSQVTTSGSSSDTTAKLDAMAAAVPSLEKRLKSNDKTIKSLSSSAQSKNKRLTKLYNLKYKQAQSDIKAKEASVKQNEKLQGAITKTGYAFTATKIAGQVMMMFPWSAAAGAVMFSVGKYGEIACYVTNASIDVANGNFAGALVNVGAAALSFASGPVKMNPATEAVKTAAEEGGKEAGKEVGKEVVQQGVQQTTQEAVKEGTEQVLTATTKEIAANPIKAAAQSSFNAMTANAGAMMQETSKAITQQMAKEAAKTALKENLKNGAIQLAGSAAQTVGQKLQAKQADEPEKKKQRRLLSYQERRNRQAKMDKIEHTKKVLMARGQNKR